MKKRKSHPYRIAGTITFSGEVSVNKLIDVCEFVKRLDPENWIDLHVRGAGDNGSHHVSFHYLLPDGENKTRKSFEALFLGFFREKFGVRPHVKGRVPYGCKSWSMSTFVVVI
ncbi:hypothetical protein H6781_02030 [Candidatus Nomurabacteria bacterium]|nr:hypothetical protein [Candidatus Nomurabacteria bacterium]MCB9818066.1 hypothetical protein [Candidatus Nomurabacteria bacterium]